ncbi:MAG: hypothetical protein AAGM04_04975 [Pseudomonadota bacterium]
MNRRRFLQSAAALLALPAGAKLSLSAPALPVSSAAAVPNQARFWAIYMSGLHGECTPQALQTLLNIPATDANRYIGQLVAEGVLKPNPLLKQAANRLMKGDGEGLWDRIKARARRKIEADGPARDETLIEPETVHLDTPLNDAEEVSAEEEGPQVELDVSDDDPEQDGRSESFDEDAEDPARDAVFISEPPPTSQS